MQEGTTDLRLWVRLLACAKIIEKGLRRNFQEQFDTTLPRFDVMAALDRAGEDGLSMSDLSRALLVSNGNVTAIVRQLQDRALIATRADPSDGRSAIVSLTAEGRSHFAQLAVAHRGWVRAALANMPPEHQAQLAHLLGELKTTLS
ncbi:MarR family winged helix-turn-helix transcriptional regulator [Novosphingobium rosa]|uniref:MarR family winged helix-turn-helix transcriptional regulator n=1 Tax=Novosphingobium rosa TaxID=76978 RepID=UPI001FE0CD75|nr:MarR family transcriptional regulator [Novosphingobium rosa]